LGGRRKCRVFLRFPLLTKCVSRKTKKQNGKKQRDAGIRRSNGSFNLRDRGIKGTSASVNYAFKKTYAWYEYGRKTESDRVG